MSPSVLSVFGDHGGAEAVVPVLAALRARGDTVAVVASPATVPLARAAGIPNVTGAVQTAAARAGSALEATGADVLLTGTSWDPQSADRAFIRAARSQGVPSIAVVDFWSNYRARFEDGGGLQLPDRIAVMDHGALAGSRREGLPTDGLVVTGNPHYETLLTRYHDRRADTVGTLRGRLGVSRHDTVVLFVSQPIAELYGDQLGYTEQGVLSQLRDALETTAGWLGHRVRLAVRTHPRDALDELPGGTSNVDVFAADGDGAIEWSLASDLVVGMTSAVLVQAAMLGCRTVSLELGAAEGSVRDWPLPEPTVIDPRRVAGEVYRRLSQPAHLHGRHWWSWIPVARGATDRIMAEVDRLATGPAAVVVNA